MLYQKKCWCSILYSGIHVIIISSILYFYVIICKTYIQFDVSHCKALCYLMQALVSSTNSAAGKQCFRWAMIELLSLAEAPEHEAEIEDTGRVSIILSVHLIALMKILIILNIYLLFRFMH